MGGSGVRVASRTPYSFGFNGAYAACCISLYGGCQSFFGATAQAQVPAEDFLVQQSVTETRNV